MAVYQADPKVMKAEFYTMEKTFDKPIREIHSWDACENLQVKRDLRCIAAGIVFRPDPKKNDFYSVQRHLRKKGEVWKWISLFKDYENDSEFNGTPVGEGGLLLLERKAAAARTKDGIA